MDNSDEKKLHETLGFIGVRAHATAVGFLQLSIELRRVGVIDDDAITRIKDAMAKDLLLSRPRHADQDAYEATLRARLDRLFAGQEQVGPERED